MRNYKKLQRKNQHQDGYVAVVALGFIMGIVVVLGSTIEIGRMLLSSTATENGVNLAVTAGVRQYGKTIKQKTKIEYEKAYKEAEKKIDEEIEAGTLIVTPEERLEKIKEEAKKELRKKKDEIKASARDECRARVNTILHSNDVQTVEVICTDTHVEVTGKKNYTGILKESPGNAEFKRSERMAISFKKD